MLKSLAYQYKQTLAEIEIFKQARFQGAVNA